MRNPFGARLGLALALLALPAAAVAAPKPAHSPRPAPAAEAAPAATLDGEPLSQAAVDAIAGPQLVQLRTEEYRIRRQALDQVIDERLLEREAKARKVTVEELRRVEIEEKAGAPTEEEVKAFHARFKQRMPPGPEADQLKQVTEHLTAVRQQQRAKEYLGTLRQGASIRVLLEPPRVEVDVADAPVRGPAGAPVTIVEFTEFQCPFCGRAAGTLDKVRERYGDKVRIVFRNFPLLQIHKEAAKAAEAATCAGEQGKFWEMYDALFAKQNALQVDQLKARAVEIGLEAAKFDECLDSGRTAGVWKRDLEAAEKRYHLNAAPAFYVNGRFLSGARPLEAFAEIIDDELQRKGITPPPPPPPTPPAAVAPPPAAPPAPPAGPKPVPQAAPVPGAPVPPAPAGLAPGAPVPLVPPAAGAPAAGPVPPGAAKPAGAPVPPGAAKPAAPPVTSGPVPPGPVPAGPLPAAIAPPVPGVVKPATGPVPAAPAPVPPGTAKPATGPVPAGPVPPGPVPPGPVPAGPLPAAIAPPAAAPVPGAPGSVLAAPAPVPGAKPAPVPAAGGPVPAGAKPVPAPAAKPKPAASPSPTPKP